MEEIGSTIEPPEDLTPADEIETIEPEEIAPPEPARAESAPRVEPVPRAETAFVPSEAVSNERLELLEQRLHEAAGRAAGEREASERLGSAIASVEERVAATLEHLTALDERLGALEKGVGGLHEALAALQERLGPLEAGAGRHDEMQQALQGFEHGLRGLEERIGGEASRQRKDADDLGMALHALGERLQNDERFRALASLHERFQTMEQQVAVLLSQTGSHEDQMSSVRWLAETIPQLEARVTALSAQSEKLGEVDARLENAVRQHRELESNFEEKTQLGRREAEDIRSQIAPLLEERVRRHESDALLFSEMERLRESLAESLHELADRVRSRVGE
jgi:chromosome segregation ATPase